MNKSNCKQSYISSFFKTQILKNSIKLNHYSDVITSTMAGQITSLTIVTQPFIQAKIKENIEAPRHWPLLGEFPGDRWIPRTKGR